MDHIYTCDITRKSMESQVKSESSDHEDDSEAIIEESVYPVSDMKDTDNNNSESLSSMKGGEEVSPNSSGKPVIVQMSPNSKRLIIKSDIINAFVNSKDTNANQKWTRDSINLLISLRSQLDEYFENPKNKKMDYWEYISNILAETGFQISPHDCHTKWRNLCGTYRMNKEKSHRLGASSVRWEFYDLMDGFMKNKQNLNDKIEAVFDEDDDEDSDDEQEMSRLLKIQAETKAQQVSNVKRTNDLSPSSQPSLKKSRADSPPLWFKEYINKREEEEKIRDDRFFAILESIKESELRKTVLLESLLQYFDRS